MSLSVRLVTAETTLERPLPGWDVTYSRFRGRAATHAPVVHLFGTTDQGRRCCAHVHGVLPYLYVPWSGDGAPASAAHQLAAGLERALTLAAGPATAANASALHVHRVTLVRGVPFYGYHEKNHLYFKIFLYNPRLVSKAAELLQSGAVLHRTFQPHETHLPYLLQFMIDYNLRGMGLVQFSRHADRRAPASTNGGAVVPTVSSCELEVDVHAADIISHTQTPSEGAAVGDNPALAQIWAEVAALCRPDQVAPVADDADDWAGSAEQRRPPPAGPVEVAALASIAARLSQLSQTQTSLSPLDASLPVECANDTDFEPAWGAVHPREPEPPVGEPEQPVGEPEQPDESNVDEPRILELSQVADSSVVLTSQDTSLVAALSHLLEDSDDEDTALHEQREQQDKEEWIMTQPALSQCSDQLRRLSSECRPPHLSSESHADRQLGGSDEVRTVSPDSAVMLRIPQLDGSGDPELVEHLRDRSGPKSVPDSTDSAPSPNDTPSVNPTDPLDVTSVNGEVLNVDSNEEAAMAHSDTRNQSREEGECEMILSMGKGGESSGHKQGILRGGNRGSASDDYATTGNMGGITELDITDMNEREVEGDGNQCDRQDHTDTGMLEDIESCTYEISKSTEMGVDLKSQSAAEGPDVNDMSEGDAGSSDRELTTEEGGMNVMRQNSNPQVCPSKGERERDEPDITDMSEVEDENADVFRNENSLRTTEGIAMPTNTEDVNTAMDKEGVGQSLPDRPEKRDGDALAVVRLARLGEDGRAVGGVAGLLAMARSRWHRRRQLFISRSRRLKLASRRLDRQRQRAAANAPPAAKPQQCTVDSTPSEGTANCLDDTLVVVDLGVVCVPLEDGLTEEMVWRALDSYVKLSADERHLTESAAKRLHGTTYAHSSSMTDLNPQVLIRRLSPAVIRRWTQSNTTRVLTYDERVKLNRQRGKFTLASEQTARARKLVLSSTKRQSSKSPAKNSIRLSSPVKMRRITATCSNTTPSGPNTARAGKVTHGSAKRHSSNSPATKKIRLSSPVKIKSLPVACSNTLPPGPNPRQGPRLLKRPLNRRGPLIKITPRRGLSGKTSLPTTSSKAVPPTKLPVQRSVVAASVRPPSAPSQPGVVGLQDTQLVWDGHNFVRPVQRQPEVIDVPDNPAAVECVEVVPVTPERARAADTSARPELGTPRSVGKVLRILDKYKTGELSPLRKNKSRAVRETKVPLFRMDSPEIIELPDPFSTCHMLAPSWLDAETWMGELPSASPPLLLLEADVSAETNEVTFTPPEPAFGPASEWLPALSSEQLLVPLCGPKQPPPDFSEPFHVNGFEVSVAPSEPGEIPYVKVTRISTNKPELPSALALKGITLILTGRRKPRPRKSPTESINKVSTVGATPSPRVAPQSQWGSKRSVRRPRPSSSSSESDEADRIAAQQLQQPPRRRPPSRPQPQRRDERTPPPPQPQRRDERARLSPLLRPARRRPQRDSLYSLALVSSGGESAEDRSSPQPLTPTLLSDCCAMESSSSSDSEALVPDGRSRSPPRKRVRRTIDPDWTLPSRDPDWTEAVETERSAEPTTRPGEWCRSKVAAQPLEASKRSPAGLQSRRSWLAAGSAEHPQAVASPVPPQPTQFRPILPRRMNAPLLQTTTPGGKMFMAANNQGSTSSPLVFIPFAAPSSSPPRLPASPQRPENSRGTARRARGRYRASLPSQPQDPTSVCNSRPAGPWSQVVARRGARTPISQRPPPDVNPLWRYRTALPASRPSRGQQPSVSSIARSPLYPPAHLLDDLDSGVVASGVPVPWMGKVSTSSVAPNFSSHIIRRAPSIAQVRAVCTIPERGSTARRRPVGAYGGRNAGGRGMNVAFSVGRGKVNAKTSSPVFCPSIGEVVSLSNRHDSTSDLESDVEVVFDSAKAAPREVELVELDSPPLSPTATPQPVTAHPTVKTNKSGVSRTITITATDAATRILRSIPAAQREPQTCSGNESDDVVCLDSDGESDQAFERACVEATARSGRADHSPEGTTDDASGNNVSFASSSLVTISGSRQSSSDSDSGMAVARKATNESKPESPRLQPEHENINSESENVMPDAVEQASASTSAHNGISRLDEKSAPLSISLSKSQAQSDCEARTAASVDAEAHTAHSEASAAKLDMSTARTGQCSESAEDTSSTTQEAKLPFVADQNTEAASEELNLMGQLAEYDSANVSSHETVANAELDIFNVPAAAPVPSKAIPHDSPIRESMDEGRKNGSIDTASAVPSSLLIPPRTIIEHCSGVIAPGSEDSPSGNDGDSASVFPLESGTVNKGDFNDWNRQQVVAVSQSTDGAADSPPPSPVRHAPNTWSPDGGAPGISMQASVSDAAGGSSSHTVPWTPETQGAARARPPPTGDCVLTPARAPPSRASVLRWLQRRRRRRPSPTDPADSSGGLLNKANADECKPDPDLHLSTSSDGEADASPVAEQARAGSPVLTPGGAGRRASLMESSLMETSLLASRGAGDDADTTYGYRVLSEELRGAPAHLQHQFLSVLSAEVHVATRGALLPDPQLDAVAAVFYRLSEDAPASWDRLHLLEGCIVVSCADWARRSPLVTVCPDALHVPNEQALFDVLAETVARLDPDILVGWEVERLSWGYLLERAELLGRRLSVEMSRLPGADPRQSQSDWAASAGVGERREWTVPGRLVLPGWRLLRSELPLRTYSWHAAAYHVLRCRLPDHSHRQLSDWWQQPGGHAAWRVAEFYMTRCRGTLEMLSRLDLLGRTAALARLFGMPIVWVLWRGSQLRVESIMLRAARRRNLVAVSPSVAQRAAARAPETIPLTLEPESALHRQPVLVLDFQSLYPSIIIAYNYCFSTCLGRADLLGNRGAFPMGCSALQVEPALLSRLLERRQVHVSPCGVAFVSADVRRGLLPTMLTDILRTRIMVKQAMKSGPGRDEPAIRRWLHFQQLGLKLIANVTYGYTAANYSGRMPCSEVADSVVSKGRETLERAARLIEAHPEWSARVIYGDTDSLFVVCPGRSRQAALALGQQMADAVTADNPHPVKLKLEKVYQPCLLQTKKRYAGFMYETADQKEPQFDAKGIETVRRDGCPLVSKVLEGTLRLLFRTCEVAPVRQYVERQFAALLQQRTPITQLVFAREYRGRAGYRPTAAVPALRIAQRLSRVDRRAEPLSGDRVPYVVVYGAPGQPLIELVRSPAELRAAPQLRPHTDYYALSCLAAALQRCLCVLGEDVAGWYQAVPRPAGALRQLSAAPLGRYLSAAGGCGGCGRPAAHGQLCGSCSRRPQQQLQLAAAQRQRAAQRAAAAVTAVCAACCRQPTAAPLTCSCLECPLLWRSDQLLSAAAAAAGDAAPV